MKFHLDRAVLNDAVSWATRALPVRPRMPILQGVRISASAEGELHLSTFDYEVSAQMVIPAEIDEPGEVLVQGRMLADIVKALPDRPVTFALDGTKVAVTCGAARFSLATMPVEEYPQLPELPPVAGTVDSQLLSDAIHQVAVAASKEETLPLLTGVRLEIEGEKLTMMATDRYRLALREITWNPTSPDANYVALVRGRTLNDVARSLATGSEVTIALASEDPQIIGFEAGGRRSTSSLVDGDYPPVRRLFPDSSAISAVVGTGELLEAVKRVSLVAERNTPVRLTFTEGQVVLEAGSGDEAQASEALEATLDGDDIVVAFNPAYLIDGLTAIGSEFTRFAFNDSIKPVVLSQQEEADSTPAEEYRYLIMPIRIPTA